MLRFTIRELFLVTLIVALSLAWLVDHRWQRAQRVTAEETTKAAELNAKYNSERLVEIERNISIYVEKYGPLTEVIGGDHYLPWFPNDDL